MSPWLLAETTRGTDSVRCFQFDGLQRNGDRPFRFAPCDTGPKMAALPPAHATWSALAPWIDSGALMVWMALVAVRVLRIWVVPPLLNFNALLPVEPMK